MQINQQLVRFNRVLTERIDKKVEYQPSKNHTEINREINRVFRGLQRLSLETETSAEFNRVKPRIINSNS